MENTTDNSGKLNQSTTGKPVDNHKVAKIIAVSAGSLIGIIVLLLVGLNFYLTPKRLQRIINEEGSRYLMADVRVSDVDYTLWSSFPNLRVSIDSVVIYSRTLNGVAPSIMSSLPKNSRRLLTTGRISGGVNLWKALRGNIALKDIEIDNPSCNLVKVNDSISNFNIFREIKIKENMPRVTFNTVEIGSPVRLSFYDAVSKMSMNAVIDEAGLKGIEDKNDNYEINMTGLIDVKTEEFSTSNSLPLNLNADIALGFTPFSMTVTECHVNLADIKTLTDLSVVTHKNSMVIGKLNLDFSCLDFLSVADYFSFPDESLMKNMAGSLPVYARLSLESPYEIPEKITTATLLPAFTLSVNIPEGEIAFPVEKGKSLSLRDVELQADLNIDPNNSDASSLLIPLARVSADGAVVESSCRITELMSGDPLLDAKVNCKADLAKAAKPLLSDNNLKIAGILEGGSSVTCRLSGLKDKTLKDINFKGDFNISSLKINDAVSKLSANLQNLSLMLRGSVPELSSAGLGDSKLNLFARSGNGNINLSADTSAFAYRNLAINGQFGAGGSMANPTLAGTVNFTTGNLNASSPGMKLGANGLEISMTADMRHVPWSPSSAYLSEPTSINDSILSKRVSHTPLYLTASVPGMLQTGLSLINLKARLKLKEGEFYTESYPAHNRVSDVNITTDLDNLTINNMKLTTRGASADLNGKVTGLRNFLLSSTPVPLKIDMDAHFSDVDINRLSGNYYAGQALVTGKPADYTVAPLGAYTASDSLCVLIPRNLYADIRLHSDRAEYMEWQFSPLSTDITLHDGIATIGDLNIGSGFGSVDVDWTYSTADLNDIFMKLNVGVNDFDFSKFFVAFPDVTASAPEMENLSGKLSATIDGKVLMFPSMFVNAPSITADMNLHTSDVAFKREGKIKRITELMLIRGDSALTINDLDIHGSFHDNMLQLDPFMIDCGPYRLGVAGVNNLQGEMYYHLGLHKSPLHAPFGVNLVGNWRHPGIRFGGAGINDSRERKISSNLSDNVNVNIMRQLKHGWLLFVEIAAKYDAENNQQYVFNVD